MHSMHIYNGTRANICAPIGIKILKSPRYLNLNPIIITYIYYLVYRLTFLRFPVCL